MNVEAAVAGGTTRECIHFNKNNSHTPIIFITVLLLFYYCFITVLLLVYYCFITSVITRVITAQS